MKEELFTSIEISAILLESSNPIYLIKNLYHPTFSKCQIHQISSKGLIFVHGNKHTGLEHISERHSITSRKLYLKDGKFDYPTKFTLAPVEYTTVADVIYDLSNLNTKKNKRSDLFDFYTGLYSHQNGKTFNYSLIVYKYTGIVHTFYLNNNSKPFNKRVKLPLSQGWSSSKYNIMTCIDSFNLNYRDIDDEIKFTVLLSSNHILRTERWYLQVYKDKRVFFTHFIKQDSLSWKHSTPLRMMQIDFQDMSFIDKIIKDIIVDKYDFGNGFGSYWSFKYE